MPRYKLTVAYDGTKFHGWQKQNGVDESLPNLRTVQQVLEDVVRHVVREPIVLMGASRTDSGVHARGQVAAFTTENELTIPIEKLHHAITSRLPDDVQVVKAERVHNEFDPISDAIAKAYRYRIAYNCALHRPPLFLRHIVKAIPHDLDVDRMNTAAQHLLGEHDFTSFAKLNHGRESPVRTIHVCAVSQTKNDRCRIDVTGNGFLYNMVRIIAGTLVEVGRGRIEPDAIPEILAAKDRTAAGSTLSPEGLCLIWIKY